MSQFTSRACHLIKPTPANKWIMDYPKRYAFCSKCLMNDPYICRMLGRFDCSSASMSPFGCILNHKMCAHIIMRAKWIVMQRIICGICTFFFGQQLLWNPKYVPFPKSTRHTTHNSYDVSIGIAGNRSLSFKTHTQHKRIYFCILSGRSTLERENIDKLEKWHAPKMQVISVKCVVYLPQWSNRCND